MLLFQIFARRSHPFPLKMGEGRELSQTVFSAPSLSVRLPLSPLSLKVYFRWWHYEA